MRGAGLARAILRAGALLAPIDDQARLARRWEAELAHRLGQGSGAEGFRLAAWALGILPHALYLRRRRWGMGGWAGDLGQPWRAVRRRPGAASVAVGMLALGIGASTAVLSVAEAVLYRPVRSRKVSGWYGSTACTGLSGWTGVVYPGPTSPTCGPTRPWRKPRSMWGGVRISPVRACPSGCG